MDKQVLGVTEIQKRLVGHMAGTLGTAGGVLEFHSCCGLVMSQITRGECLTEELGPHPDNLVLGMAEDQSEQAIWKIANREGRLYKKGCEMQSPANFTTMKSALKVAYTNIIFIERFSVKTSEFKSWFCCKQLSIDFLMQNTGQGCYLTSLNEVKESKVTSRSAWHTIVPL